MSDPPFLREDDSLYRFLLPCYGMRRTEYGHFCGLSSPHLLTIYNISGTAPAFSTRWRPPIQCHPHLRPSASTLTSFLAPPSQIAPFNNAPVDQLAHFYRPEARPGIYH